MRSGVDLMSVAPVRVFLDLAASKNKNPTARLVTASISRLVLNDLVVDFVRMTGIDMTKSVARASDF